MSDNKTIITIDTVFDSFKEFNALFSKYKNDLKELPGGWAKVDKEIGKIHNPFEGIQKSVKAVQAPFNELKSIAKETGAQIKASATNQDKFRVATIGAAKSFGAIAKSAVNTGKSIAGITKSIAGWVGIATGIGGALVGGTLFGFDKLAQSQGGQRKSAQGLGMSTGELSATKITYDKVLDDSESVLAKINEAKNDFSKRGQFYANGISSKDFEGSNAEILNKLVLKAKDTTDKGGKNYQQYAQAKGLTDLLGTSNVTRIHEQQHEELNLLGATNAKRIKQLSQDEQSLRKFQDFTASIQTAGQHIENVLGDHLVRLAGPLGNLSDAFSNAVAKLLDTGKIDEWINTLSDDIKQFSDWISSDDGKKDIQEFFDGVATAAETIAPFVKALSWVADVFKWVGTGIGVSVGFVVTTFEKVCDFFAKFIPGINSSKPSAPAPTQPTANGSPHPKMSSKSALSAEAAKQAVEANKNADYTNQGKSLSVKQDEIAKLAAATQAKYGVPAEVTQAQYNIESGGGKHMPSGSNNPFGIKATKDDIKAGKFVEAMTTEHLNGIDVRILQKFKKFDSLADAFDAHAKLLATRPQYANARKHANDPKAFADALTGVYATDPHYGEKLKAEISKQAPRVSQNTTNASQSAQQQAQSKSTQAGRTYQQPVNVTINKSAGADVNTTVNAMSPSSV